MSFNISSDRLSNPLLKDLLEKLTTFFNSIGSEFYIIGATARDIILSGIHHQPPSRMTDDLDIAIAIPEWSKYNKIAEELCKTNDFVKSKQQKQRFIYKNHFLLDIVPFGEIARADHNIYWPPDETPAMSVIGFTEVMKCAITVTVDNVLILYVASLPGIFILKLNSWHDRYIETNQDADDMAYIISIYLEINEERAAKEHYDLYESEPFSKFTAGASLMGRDIKEILEPAKAVLDDFKRILQIEVEKREESTLINQILETHPSLHYEDVFNGLSSLFNELNK